MSASSDVCHADDILKIIENLFNDPELSDLCLCADGQQFHLHRSIVFPQSEVIRALFESADDVIGGDLYHRANEVNHNSYCMDHIADFFRYFYTGKLKLTVENAVPMILLSYQYKVTNLAISCRKFFKEYLGSSHADVEVAFRWYWDQNLRANDHLKFVSEICFDTMKQMLGNVINCPTVWLGLSFEDVLALLKSSDVTLKDEFSLYKAATRWLLNVYQIGDDNEAEFRTRLGEFLEYVRFPMMSVDQLNEIQENCTLFKHFSALYDALFVEAYRYHCSRNLVVSEHPRFQQRNYTGCPVKPLLATLSRLQEGRTQKRGPPPKGGPGKGGNQQGSTGGNGPRGPGGGQVPGNSDVVQNSDSQQGTSDGNRHRDTDNGHHPSDGAKGVDSQGVRPQNNVPRTPDDCQRPIHSNGPENPNNQQGKKDDNSSRGADGDGYSGAPGRVDNRQGTRDGNGPRGTGNGHELSDSDGASALDNQHAARQNNGSRTPDDAKRPIHSDPGRENVNNQQLLVGGDDKGSRYGDSRQEPGYGGTPGNVDKHQGTKGGNSPTAADEGQESSNSDGRKNVNNQQATVNSKGSSGADNDAQGQSSENDNRRRPTDVKRPGDIATGSDYQSSLGETSGDGASLHYTDMSNAEVSRFNGNPVQSSENAAISSDMDAQIFEDFTFNIAAYPDIQRENGDHDYSEYQEGTIGSDTFEKELSRQQSHEHDAGGNGQSIDDTTVTENDVDEEGRAQSSQTTPVSSPSAAGTTDGAANGDQSGREGKEGGKGGKGEDEKYR